MTAVNKASLESKKAEWREEVAGIKQELQAPPEVKSEEPVADPPPFGGGTLLGLVINPTSAEVQALTGYDESGFSNSRTYGGSLYLPLQQHCSRLVESTDPVDRMVGYKHLSDRFMIKRAATAPFSEAETNMYNAAQQIGQDLLDKGAIPPLVFPRVSVFGHRGMEMLDGYWIPSCGYRLEDVVEVFQSFMAKPENWIAGSRLQMQEAYERIKAGKQLPLRGYTK